MIERMEYYCSEEMIDQIYKGGSDNRNESLHSTVTSLSPKRAFYLRSGTYRAQVLAGCLQKNLGQGWEKLVLEEVGVLFASDPKLPGSILFEKLKKATKQDVESKSSKEKKRRRAELKAKRKKKHYHVEKLEGCANANYSSKGFELLPKGKKVVDESEFEFSDEEESELDNLPTEDESIDSDTPIAKRLNL
jgi:hypothetical protein